MPEIKSNFTQGKMNKDLDERLVPKGQYRDAINIQLINSEGSHVGAIENVLGNTLVSTDQLVDPGATCVGAISDEGKNRLYYFVATKDSGYPVYSNNEVMPSNITGWYNSDDNIAVAPPNWMWRDKIFRISKNSITPVFVDTYQTKTTFDDTNAIYNLPGGLNGEYVVNATEGVYKGMVCYFFNGAAHGNVVNDPLTENDFSGPNKTLSPQLYGSRSIRRTVVSAEYDSSLNKTIVVFDKDLTEEHSNISSPLNNTGHEFVNVSKVDFNYLIFTKERILNFNCGNLITGINVLDDFLLWTDNESEPKKLNISRSIEGTHFIGEKPTRLIVPGRNITSTTKPPLAKPEHVNVIKKSPTAKLIIEKKLENPTTAVNDNNFVQPDGSGGFELIESGKDVIVQFTQFNFGNNFDVGDELRFLNSSSSLTLPDAFDVRCEVIENFGGQEILVNGQSLIPAQYWPANTYGLKILSIAPGTPIDTSQLISTTHTFNVQRVLDNQSLFERKLVRFGYRWRYQDGEYSTFSPFTDTVFSPSFFEYDATLGYNKGMQNYLTEITLRNVVSNNIPDDVVQIDLLYSESNGTTVYVVDKIKYNDEKNISIKGNQYNNWQVNQYRVKSDIIYAAVPANQLLRPWDNVPRMALAQEVTGSRVVYANYLQNYNITESGKYKKPMLQAGYDKRWNTGVNQNFATYGKPVFYDINYFDSFGIQFPKLNFPRLKEKLIEPLLPLPSLKSIRKYQLGFTYLDEYGRETPVFSGSESTVSINKKEANETNLLTSNIITSTPGWAKGFKMYIKETSNEYYNLALDRVYKAEDGNLWLSFPSSERNKVDEQTFLILKKGADSNSLVVPEARYKVIAIENEAPDFIKTKKRLLAEGAGATNTTGANVQFLFLDSSLASTLQPTLNTGSKSFKINEAHWKNESSVSLQETEGPLQFDFKDVFGNFSKKYDIANISLDDVTDVYTVVLDTPILASESWMFANGVSGTMVPTLKIRFYKSVTRLRPEFDGKFFVKINGDSTSDTFLNATGASTTLYQIVSTMQSWYFSDTGKFGISEGSIGNAASSTNVNGIWDDYTSSGYINPHDGTVGAVIHTGSVSVPDVQGSGFESTDGVDDWTGAFDFGTSTQEQSNWFIDEIYYAGTHPLSSSVSINSPNHVSGGDSNFNYGKGIHKDGSQDYIEISFGQINPDACVSGNSITNGTTLSPKINYSDFNLDYIWEIGSSQNQSPPNPAQFSIVNKLTPGSKFRFSDDNLNTIYTITGNVTKERRYNHTAWDLVQFRFDAWLATVNGGNPQGTPALFDSYETTWERFGRAHNRRVTYRIPVDKNILTETTIGTSNDPVTAPDVDDAAANGRESVNIEFIEPRIDDDVDILLSNNPAIFETEPKESIDLDIFYAISEVYPTNLNINTIEKWVPKGSVVTCKTHPLILDFTEQTFVSGYDQNIHGQLMIKFNVSLNYFTNPIGATELVFTRPDGGFTTLIGDWYTPRTFATDPTYVTESVINPATSLPFIPNETGFQVYPQSLPKNKIGLSWFNTYCFRNGVESNRLRDDFNQVFLSKGVTASTVIDSPYEEERRSSGLIYSGLYNSISGVNNLNQFIQAEKITKDLNPTYGSIQKLFSRNTDLITFCEDRVIRIAANKDAIFNADGNPQLIKSENVLGQVLPFTGDYGISTNPESFSKESYRVYFTDAKNGAVLRLSKDGMTNIADYGMSDYFKKNLKNYGKILGTYDDNKSYYNLTLTDYNCNTKSTNTPKTISYSESAKGWVSFKSFIPEHGMSMENNYYTFLDGTPWKHHTKQKRNTFYGDALINFYPSSVEFYLNDAPDVVKSFKTLNYEGSQAEIRKEIPGTISSTPNQGFYNLNKVTGWYSQYIVTDLQKGMVDEFIEKEGKWFNYIKGNKNNINPTNMDTSSFHIQGIGRAIGLSTPIYGCMDPNATNQLLTANVDDGTCIYAGCIDPNSYNGVTQFIHTITGVTYNATIDDGSCIYGGCMDPNANNYNSLATFDPTGVTFGSCTYVTTWDCNLVAGGCIANNLGTGTYSTLADCQALVTGCPPCGTSSSYVCADPAMMNYDPTIGACHDQTLCIPYAWGCWDSGDILTSTQNQNGYPLFPALQTQLDDSSTCFALGATVPTNFNSNYIIDPFVSSPTYGLSIPVISTDMTAAGAVWDPATSTIVGYNQTNFPGNAGMDCSCEYEGCMDCGSIWETITGQLCDPVNFPSGMTTPGSSNYQPFYTVSKGCCVDGCTDPSSSNYDLLATCDDGSCTYFTCATVPTVSGTGAGATQFGLFVMNSPWLGAPITNTMVPDPVFEEVLETFGSLGSFSNLFANTLLAPNLDGECCTIGFSQNTSLATTSSTLLGSGGWANTDTFGSGVINDLTGLQDFGLPLFDTLTGLPTTSSTFRFRYLLIHLQNITSFTHSETDPSSNYFGLDMLDTFSSSWTGTTFGAGVSSISLKSLPLSGLNKLNLSMFTYLTALEITDCGIADIILPSTSNPIHPGVLQRLIITNNYLPTTNYNNAAKTSNFMGNTNDSFEGHSYVGYPGINPNLPDSITGVGGGENLNYNGSQDQLGSPGSPVKITFSGSSGGNYYPSYIGSNNWDHATSGSGGAVVASSIIRLINLPSLIKFYVSFNITVVNKMQNVYGTSTHEPQHRAAFTTKGCHPDLKIHVGSLAMVSHCEQAYGTARQYIDEPVNTVINPNWSPAGETFFLEYFEPGHRFTT